MNMDTIDYAMILKNKELLAKGNAMDKIEFVKKFELLLQNLKNVDQTDLSASILKELDEDMGRISVYIIIYSVQNGNTMTPDLTKDVMDECNKIWNKYGF